jgi:hypothetical protein
MYGSEAVFEAEVVCGLGCAGSGEEGGGFIETTAERFFDSTADVEFATD